MTWENEHIPAILNVWFGGSEAGDAICDVLFGDRVPGGRLVTSMPKSTGQLPLYYNHLNTGRPERQWFSKFRSNFLDVDNDPLFPFGYGLSYTTFSYGEVRLDRHTLHEGGKITAAVDVTNTGAYDADEVVQLYIRDVAGLAAGQRTERIPANQSETRRNEDRIVRCHDGRSPLL